MVQIHLYFTLFSSARSGLAGSAVCSYSQNDIQKLFSTSQYLEEVKMENPGIIKARVWKKVPPPTNGEIPSRPKVRNILKLYWN